MLDPITDMLNRIRNAQAVSHEAIEVPFSKLKEDIAKILEEQKIIKKLEVKKKKNNKILKLFLNYNDKIGVIINYFYFKRINDG